MPLTFVWNRGTEHFGDARFIRETVFIHEQGFAREFDEIDRDCLHVTVYDGGAAVATARMFQDGEGYHAGRIAVLKPYRGKNVGASMMREIIRKAAGLGAKKIIVGAQQRAAGFYRKLGFQEYGEPYLEEGCPHIPMELAL